MHLKILCKIEFLGVAYCLFRPLQHAGYTDKGTTFLIPSRIKSMWFCTITFQAEPTSEPWKLQLDLGILLPLQYFHVYNQKPFLPNFLWPHGQNNSLQHLTAVTYSRKCSDRTCHYNNQVYVCYVLAQTNVY